MRREERLSQQLELKWHELVGEEAKKEEEVKAQRVTAAREAGRASTTPLWAENMTSEGATAAAADQSVVSSCSVAKFAAEMGPYLGKRAAASTPHPTGFSKSCRKM